MSERTPWVVYLSDPLPEEIIDPVAELGGKGTSLRRLKDAGCEVPRGFTIRTSACGEFLEMDDWPVGLWEEVCTALQRLEDETGRTFSPGSSSLLVAVRSGAAISMPGLLQTVLDCSAADAGETPSTDERFEPVRAAIVRVWTSWNSEPAQLYRRRLGIDDGQGTAVTVQEMIATDVAGVMFTNDPDITIEAVEGTGMALMSGNVTPAHFQVHLAEDIVSRHHSDASASLSGPMQLFADEQLPELSRMGGKLEQLWGEPLDIEWGAVDGTLIVFQARPQVGRTKVLDVESYRRREVERLRQASADRPRLWVRHNLSETLPTPTPLTWCLWRQFMSGDGGLGALYHKLGYAPSPEVCRDGFLELIGGEIYADADRAVAMFGKAFPFVHKHQALQRDPTLIDRMPTHFDPDRTGPWFLFQVPALLMTFWTSGRRVHALMQAADRRFDNEVLPGWLANVRRQRSRDLSRLTDDELTELFAVRRRWVLDEFGPESLLPGMLGGMAFVRLQREVIDVLGDIVGGALIPRLMPPGDARLVERQRDLLQKVACDDTGLPEFMDEFGHRTTGEMELRTPRWRETPEVLRTLALLSKEMDENRAATVALCQQVGDRPMVFQESLQELRRQFRNAGALSLVAPAERSLEQVWRFLPYRETGKHYLLMGYELLRQVTEELSRRHGWGDDIYFLTTDELMSLGREEKGIDHWRDVASRRRIERELCRQIDWPVVLDSGNLAGDWMPEQPHAAMSVLTGRALAPGVASGRLGSANALMTTSEAYDPAILVCRVLEPAMLPLLTRVVGVVVERGGTLSHGAVVARQLGIPAVAIDQACGRLPAGTRVCVDGERGAVQLLRDDAC